jgi:DNA-binding SARP family transcriptional activator/tetratricopeptide (TPR) repeat protein
MWFGILGPLLVRDGDLMIDVPGARLRVLLAALMVQTGTPVSADALAESVWDGAPPAGAATTLRTHVMRLRRVLGPGAGGRVLTRYPGYLLKAGENEVDLLRFTRLCQDGGAAVRAGTWARATQLLGEALALWRGDPLADVPSGVLHRDEVPRLVQLRLQALEWRIDARLHLGGHGDLVPELQSLAAQHPLRERFHAQLMLALYRCGRQAEALAAYQYAYQVLIEELGTNPGPRLQELHQQILTADPALDIPEPDAPASQGVVRAVPRQLPAGVRHFTGRADELAALTGLLEQPGQDLPGAVVISAIGGTAGVGKTALAVHWAHQVAEHFPDGQLYVDLRGYDPDRPVLAAEALAGFLRALGETGQDIPAGEAERAARYRSLLAGRRVLVVADNAGAVEQVRPLLPGTPSCAVVVTSRDALTGLVARDGARRLDLDVLPLADAVSLLRALIGARVDADPGAATGLAAQCCRLPLALRVAAELAAARPGVPLAGLVGELADQQRRLDLLDAGGDPRTAVRTVFSWSYRHLDDGAARTFRLTGLHPGPDLDCYAAAALTGATAERAGQLLELLARAHLIHGTGPGRYGVHDLLRAYARELPIPGDAEVQRRAALTRLFDYYLLTAATAMDTLFPAERHRRPVVPPSATPAPSLAQPAAARAWLDAERAALTAVAAHAADHGWPSHATRLAAILSRYLDVGHHAPDAITIHARARQAARRTGDRAAEATALTSLGVADWQQGRFQHATDHFRTALTLYRETGDRTGQARTLNNLGVADSWLGRYQQATGYFRTALTLYRETGDRTGQARALGNLGVVARRLGRYQQATRYQQQSLALCRETGDRPGEAEALTRLGDIDLRLGRYQQATEHLRQALALFRETGNRSGEAEALTRLGDREVLLGRYQQATSYQQQSLTLCRETGDRLGEAEALNGLGEALLALNQPSDARFQHAAALTVASEVGDKHGQARAHHGLGHVHDAAGNPGQARHHWREAITLYADLGAPEADQVRAQLIATDDGRRGSGDGTDEPPAA